MYVKKKINNFSKIKITNKTKNKIKQIKIKYKLDYKMECYYKMLNDIKIIIKRLNKIN